MSEKRVAWVTFDSLAAGGEAVGRDETGKAIFAPFAAPGDVAQIEIEAEKASFARGLVRSLDAASSLRVAPVCPHFRPETPHSSCGGCSWQHVSLQAQREAKREIVAAALGRLGGQSIEVEPCRGADGFGYRNKADFVLGHDERGAHIGFFARESHELVPIDVCPIQNPANETLLRAAKAILEKCPGWAFNAATGRGDWRRLVVRVATNGEMLATIVTVGPAWSEAPKCAQLLRERVPTLVGVLSRGPKSSAKFVWGREFLTESVSGLEFRVSGEAFWQINPQLSPELAQTAVELAAVRPGERALDLFCGAGLFALHMARAGAIVTGIEAHRGAIKDARFNATANKLSATFIAGDTARELKAFKAGGFDLVLLDPPRAGAAESIDSIVRIAPQRVVYVSCDPATLARDAKRLGEGGYQLKRAIPFDLFPQTSHVETATLFTRR